MQQASSTIDRYNAQPIATPLEVMPEATLIQLRRHLNAVVSRRQGQAVGLWGETGVGKTFTAQTLLRETPLQEPQPARHDACEEPRRRPPPPR